MGLSKESVSSTFTFVDWAWDPRYLGRNTAETLDVMKTDFIKVTPGIIVQWLWTPPPPPRDSEVTLSVVRMTLISWAGSISELIH